MSQSQTQAKPQNGTKPKETSYIVVDFLDLDTSKFSFADPKENSHGGKYVSLRYDNKALYVRYGQTRTVPFGINENTGDEKEAKAEMWKDGKKVTGYGFAMSFQKEYEKDPYYIKARELDEFFIEKCIQNCVRWGLGGAPGRPAAREVIAGYDEKGTGGSKWLYLVKWSKKKDKATGAVEYLPYPPRMEFTLKTDNPKITVGADGFKTQESTFETVIFDADGQQVIAPSSRDKDDLIPKFSRLSCVAQWTSFSLGVYGCSLKPKATQCRVYPSESRPNNDQCMLDDDEEGHEIPNMLGGAPPETLIRAAGVPQKVATKPSTMQLMGGAIPPQPETPAEVEAEQDGEGVDMAEQEQEQEGVEEEQEVPREPTPPPKPVVGRRTIAKKTA